MAYVDCPAGFMQATQTATTCKTCNLGVNMATKNKNAMANNSQTGGAFYDPMYGETCLQAYTEKTENRCTDDNGVQFATQCASGTAGGKANNCYESWCVAKWCYVDPCNCDASDLTMSTFFGNRTGGGALWYSYATCGSSDSGYTAASLIDGHNAKATGGVCWNQTADVTKPSDSCNAWVPTASTGGATTTGSTDASSSGAEHASFALGALVATVAMMQ